MVSAPPMEWSACDLCGADDWETLFIGRDRRHHLPGEFGVTCCRRCGHLQTNPRPTQKALPAYYPETYSAHSEHCSRVHHSRRNVWLLHWGRRFGSIGAILTPIATYRLKRILPLQLWEKGQRLLDIGCGTGWLIGLAKEVGLQPLGIDLSFTACQKARDLWGVATLCADGGALPFQASGFDIVVLLHVLEHLPSPRRSLQGVYHVLRPCGWVVIEVPNAKSFGRWLLHDRWKGWDLPRHLHHFTPQTLRWLLERVGFRTIRVTTVRYKPSALVQRWVPGRNFLVKAFRSLLSIPAWLWLPMLVVKQQGELLRAWAQK